MPEHCPDAPLRSALLNDLYQLTMARAYDAEGMGQSATFELFFRTLPSCRNYAIAAGLADSLTYLEQFQFTESDLDYLKEQGPFPEPFLDRLKHLRFTGDVDAVPEGTVIFPHEPLLRVTAPILEAQLVETFLLNQVHFQTVAASKAARVMIAAAGRRLVDFGSRRAHGTDAAMKVARCSWLVGADGTSNLLAGKTYGIPIFGTMAHSYIQAHDSERAAFAAFARLFPGTTLLVDTYDTLEGVRQIISLRDELGSDFHPASIRLDSGDLAGLACKARTLLDEAGMNDVKIFASGGLDEYSVWDLVHSGAPIDGFGVGTKMAVSEDAPSLDMAYKLVEYGGQARMKLSTGKKLYPGTKQVFRYCGEGRFTHDVLARADEELDGEPLLKPVMQGGKRLPDAIPSLNESREYALRQIASLPDAIRSIEPAAAPYPVRYSAGLESEREEVEDWLDGET
ncbi:Nicotinate phosphoribosyltransferase pncB2 [Maioricimonas rarisocia]|uniref:Nicotinate phosphoribosyltransferase n=1 Tax=Maioricimonas rarisocia TaxID=2528026 RepID=A0A517Z6V7_9PLAN|nr:nicotinate phosphoribosyltransferase [Maioricimonas rarisocia]QDU38225.1 Nicotinate phosphoribosyltransferase pncB2 [Maioricimonas rarisocia]